MSHKQQNPFIVVPYCIYHYKDYSTQTFYGFIGNPIKVRKNNEDILECRHPPPEYGSWFYYGSFYALNPMIRPIPSGLKLINSIKSGGFPYDTKYVKYAYDPFNIRTEAVSFLTWTQAVSDTVPLYIHISPDGDVFPSFDKNPPSNQPNWTQDKISPIFVLVDPSQHFTNLDSALNPISHYNKGSDGIPQFKFLPSDGRCIPDPNGVSIEQCFLLTDEDIFHTAANFGPRSLLEQLQFDNKIYTQKSKSIKHFFKHISPTGITICIIIMLVSLVVCIIILGKTKNKNEFKSYTII